MCFKFLFKSLTLSWLEFGILARANLRFRIRLNPVEMGNEKSTNGQFVLVLPSFGLDYVFQYRDMLVAPVARAG